MKCVRFIEHGGEKAHIGFIDGNVVRVVYGTLETYWRVTDETYPLDNVQLLAPCVPRQIIWAGFNYPDDFKKFGYKDLAQPDHPALFCKAAHTIIGTDANIIYPKQTKKLVYEAELGVVIKKQMKNVTPEEVKDYVLGYTCANDVTARDLQTTDYQWLRSKSFDTFCPLGPWIETDLDAIDLLIRSYLNGELKQEVRTSEMHYNLYELFSFISLNMTFYDGDIVLNGNSLMS